MAAKSSSSSSSKIVAEYAKSDRSSCKQCSKTISASALRIGLVSRDSRGFDMTKWHHLQCFPLKSNSVATLDSINGFSALKSDDQEELKRLMEENESLNKQVHQRDDNEDNEQDNRKIKKKKPSLSAETDELEVSFPTSEFKNKYKDATLLPHWKAFETVIFLERVDGLHDSQKIAAFDFDGCLVNTSVRRIGADAWSLMYPSIPEKLQELYTSGYKLVIFTNESNIERWKKKRQVAVDSKIGRLENFIKEVKVPIQVFIACGPSTGQTEDLFRKPNPGMWHIMERLFNSGLQIDMDKSFYVGDAAGRPNDQSNADIKFAEAIGLKFHVPEEYFTY